MNLQKFVLGDYQSNCYILYDNFKAMIIDPGYESKELMHFLDDNGLQVEVIYVTHGHIDHIGGVNALKRKFKNATVYAPIKDQYWYSRNPRLGLHETLLVDVYVKENDVVLFLDKTFKVIETPGHSYGSTILYFDKVLFSGDTLFKNSIGRTDLYLGDFRSIMDSIKNKILTLPLDTIVFPGHGSETILKNEKENNPFIKEYL
ncbi:MAG: MBL fold metallo-hydrolase [Acholeplasmataceae bacterium]